MKLPFDANAASNGNTGYHGDDIYNSGILTLHYSALLGKGTNKLIYNEGRDQVLMLNITGGN